jgi:hypothetical protein
LVDNFFSYYPKEIIIPKYCNSVIGNQEYER